MFEGVNEIAVLGTTFLMMAVSTVWYSQMLFGNAWMKAVGLTDEDVEKARPHLWKQMVVTFVSYAFLLLVLAHAVLYAPLLGLEALTVAIVIGFFLASFGVASVVWEGRSLQYYAINVGFYFVFVVSGTLILEYWPW